jgi:dihydrofolate reductase
MLSIIAAMTCDRVIGYKNKMPWHLPRELKHFQQITKHKSIIMGRSTYESIGHALPNRRNIVLTTQKNIAYSDAKICSNIHEALNECDHENNNEVIFIGGESIYKQTIHLVDRMYLTIIDLKIKGDAFFPSWDSDKWECIKETEHLADQDNPYNYKCLWLDKK